VSNLRRAERSTAPWSRRGAFAAMHCPKVWVPGVHRSSRPSWPFMRRRPPKTGVSCGVAIASTQADAIGGPHLQVQAASAVPASRSTPTCIAVVWGQGEGSRVPARRHDVL